MTIVDCYNQGILSILLIHTSMTTKLNLRSLEAATDSAEAAELFEAVAPGGEFPNYLKKKNLFHYDELKPLCN